MNRYVPYGKMSKKQRKALDREKRVTWGGLDPVTRIKPNGKAYDRRKARSRDDGPERAFFVPRGTFCDPA